MALIPSPPARLSDKVGDSDFEKTGAEFLDYFKKYVRLEKSARVLEIGCGVGRMAIPLTTYLNSRGCYVGVDIWHEGIDWCRENITKHHPNFKFECIDIYNSVYNPSGKIFAERLALSFQDASFDFVFLTSVFTHMLPADIQHYFWEIRRVLGGKGRLFATYFLINKESEKLIEEGKSSQPFVPFKDYYTINPENPEAAMAYAEKRIRAMYRFSGFQIGCPIRYGSWCGRKQFTSYQDMIVATKKSSRYFLKKMSTLAFQIRENFFLESDHFFDCGKDAKISIVIPTLSRESQSDHLPKLEKLLSVYLPKQTHQNYEAIVYCDGPNKAVSAMIERLQDSRVRFFATETTLGLWGHPQTRAGIKIASGDYFVRMNDDNRPYPHYLKTLFSAFGNDTGIVYGRVLFCGEARKTYDSWLYPSWILPRDLEGRLEKENIDSMNYMVHMPIAKKYAKAWSDHYAADWDFLSPMIKNSVKVKFVDRILGEKC